MWQWIAVGIVLAVTAAYLIARAITKRHRRNTECRPDACDGCPLADKCHITNT